MGETPFFFPLGGERLFGVLHRPESGRSARGMVLCHAMGDEKLWSQRVYVHLARDLAARGTAVLRFDFRGEGDSDGEFEHCSLTTRIEDAERAAGVLVEEVPGLRGVVLFGHRLGACVAAAAAGRPAARALGVIAWDPIASGKAYLMQLLRTALVSEMSRKGSAPTRAALIQQLEAGSRVSVAGYAIGPAFYRELVAMEWARLAKEAPCGAVTLEGLAALPCWRDSGRLHGRVSGMTEGTLQSLEGIGP